MEHGNHSTTPHRRNRRPISCLSCRQRKLRCDRALPACENCITRNAVTECCYIPRKTPSQTKQQESVDHSTSGQSRIDRLEQLVLTLLKNQNANGRVDTLLSGIDTECDGNSDHANVDNSDQELHNGAQLDGERTANVSRASTVIKISADYKQSLSVDEAHWMLLLNEIGEVRSYLCAQQKQYDEQSRRISRILRRSSEDPGPTLLFGTARHSSRSEILSQVPSKYTCDILVTRFFSHLYPALYVLHGPTFYRQYERFWDDQEETSIVWVALLFGVLRIAVLDFAREGDEPVEYKGKCQDLATNFRSRLADCLILADYLRPHEFLVEALILHQYAEYASNRDVKSSVWVLNGTIVRLAMRMGFHQNCQPNLLSTPFLAEMRRRAWAFVRQADILLSFQMGLPSMIRLRSFESTLPRNIHDDESFDEDCTTLPAALPDSEPTQISYLIAKTKLAFGFARAVKEIQRADNVVEWEKILEIDRDLRRIYDNVPEYYKLGKLSSQESFILISARFTLANIHHKSLCVVHSRFLEIAKSDQRYLYSRRVCLSSAMSLLRFQAIQNQELPVDGRSRSLTKYQTSLIIHDYLLAATIICADLCSNSFANNDTNPENLPGVPTRVEMIKALKISARIFSQMRDQSIEAYKAGDVLGMLVQKLEVGARNAVGSPEHARRSQTGHSSGSKVNGPNSVPGPSNAPRVPRVFTTPSESSSSATLGNGIGLEADPPRPPQRLLRSSPLVQQGVYTDISMLEGPASIEATSLDFLPTWDETQENDHCPQAAPFQLTFPDFEASTGWMLPEDMDVSNHSMLADGNSGNSSLGTANTLSYTASLAFDDPVSTLWNLNSGTRGGSNRE